MLIRSLASVLVVVSAFICATGQDPAPKKGDADKSTDTTKNAPPQRDMPLPGGVNLVFLIKELARDMNLNVLIDPESKLETRSIKIELRNVTTAQALTRILAQEGLISGPVGPGIILVTSRSRVTWMPKIGVAITPLTGPLAGYFGVQDGLIINNVRPDSLGYKAELKPGDVIVAFDNEPVRGALDLTRAIENKKEGDITLKIVRERKDRTLSLRLSDATP
jgi:S1-C subfamily serine protease